MKPTDFLNAMNDLPEHMIAEADILPDAPEGKPTKKRRREAPAFLSSPAFAIAASLVVAFGVVGLIVQAGRNAAAKPPVIPAGSISALPETAVSELNGDVYPIPAESYQILDVPCVYPGTLTVPPICEQGQTSLTVTLTAPEPGKHMVYEPAFSLMLTQILPSSDSLYGGLIPYEQPVELPLLLAPAFTALVQSKDDYATGEYVLKLGEGLTPGVYVLTYTGRTNEGSPAPSCTFCVGYGLDAHSVGIFDGLAVTCGETVVRTYQIFKSGKMQNESGADPSAYAEEFTERYDSRIKSPHLTRDEGMVLITNTTDMTRQVNDIRVYDLETGRIVYQINNNDPIEMKPGEFVVLTFLDDLVKFSGTYCVEVCTTVNYENNESAGRWLYQYFSNIFYLTTLPEAGGVA